MYVFDSAKITSFGFFYQFRFIAIGNTFPAGRKGDKKKEREENKRNVLHVKLFYAYRLPGLGKI